MKLGNARCVQCGKVKRMKKKGVCPSCRNKQNNYSNTRVLPQVAGSTIKIFFDGGTKGNRIAFVDTRINKRIVKVIKGKNTNNELEYYALLLAIRYAQRTYDSYGNLEFIGDSRLIIKQVNGEYKVKNNRLAILHEQVIDELKYMEFKKSDLIEKVKWVSREHNLAGLILDDLK